MLYELPLEKHDSLICGEIGAVVAHDYRSKPGFVVLTIRTGGPPAVVIDAIAATHPKPVPVHPEPPEMARIRDGTATLKDVIEYLKQRDGLA